ncbi:MAG: DNA translocase FtsK, partial [Ruthenibacterium sp.]
SKAGRERTENAACSADMAHVAEFDIDLGPGNVTTKLLHTQENVAIGPGGTFGLAGLNGAQPGTAVVMQDAEFGTIITRNRTARLPNVPNTTPFVPAPATGCTASATGCATPAAQQPAARPTEETSLVEELARLAQKAAAPLAQEEAAQAKAVSVREDTSTGYAFPPLSLFQKQPPDNEENVQAELTHNAELLVKTLASFGVQTKILDINRGPSVTRYELQPLAGVKISRITGLADDIALNLATTGVRIEAPIPGKAAVGVEIPNKTRSIVSFRSILESPEFSTQTAPLAFAVGKGIAGHAQVGNLAKMPHLLIAGTTGSGKSVCTNGIIMSFLYRCPPEKLRLILIDPKMVEFAQYNGIPHLLMPVVTEPRKAAGALGSAVAEMEKRYHL